MNANSRYDSYDLDAIYGDPRLGHWNDSYAGSNNIEIDENYKMTWPDGYWERYEELRQTALRVSKAISVHMVMRLDGRYHVYALMSSGANLAGPVYGKVATDRHAAWENFINKFEAEATHSKAAKPAPMKSDSLNGVKDVQEFGRRFREEKKRRR